MSVSCRMRSACDPSTFRRLTTSCTCASDSICCACASNFAVHRTLSLAVQKRAKAWVQSVTLRLRLGEFIVKN
jgi:hypothetical protein